MTRGRVILDTNFVLVPFQFKLDIFSELGEIVPSAKIFILDKTLEEIKKINKGYYLSLVKKFINLKKITILETTESSGVDDLLVIYGKKGYIIATNDKELKSRLEKNKISYIYMRQKRTLVLRKFD